MLCIDLVEDGTDIQIQVIPAESECTKKLMGISSTTINDAIQHFRIFSISLSRSRLLTRMCLSVLAETRSFMYMCLLMYRHYYVIVASSSIHFAAINCRRKIKAFVHNIYSIRHVCF